MVEMQIIDTNRKKKYLMMPYEYVKFEYKSKRADFINLSNDIIELNINKVIKSLK